MISETALVTATVGFGGLVIGILIGAIAAYSEDQSDSTRFGNNQQESESNPQASAQAATRSRRPQDE